MWASTSPYNFVLNTDLTTINTKIRSNPHVKMEDIAKVDRGSLPPKLFYKGAVDNKKAFNWFDGQIYRYQFIKSYSVKIKCDDLNEFKTADMFIGKQILLRQLISRQFRLNAMIVDRPFGSKRIFIVFMVLIRVMMRDIY